MPKTKKPTCKEAFENNMKDAALLILYARGFTNQRKRKIREELRNKIGETFNVPEKQRGQVAGIEGDNLFVVLKPGCKLTQDDFVDPSFLLRQALVAGCAALETFVADAAMEFVGGLLRSPQHPDRLLKIQLTMGKWLESEKLQKSGWAKRAVVEEHIRETSSTAPNKIGVVLSTVGIKNWLKTLDQSRGLPGGTTEAQLEDINKRRNSIAHTGDRKGHGKAKIHVEEVERYLDNIRATVRGIEKIMSNHKV